MNSVIRNRTLTCLLLAFSFSTYLAISAQAQGGPPWPPFELKQESDGLYTFQVGARRNLVLIGSEGVIITDPVNEETAKIYRDEIAKVTDKPIKYVVYSSSLWGRIRGGRVFKAEGAQIVAHEMCAQELKDTPHPDVVMPDITFTDKYNISVGDVSLDLVHLGANYGTCSPVMIAQPANMMFLVNIVNPPYAQVPWDPTIPNFHLHKLVPFFHAVEDYAAQNKIESVMGAYMSVERRGDGKPYLLPAAGPISVVAEQRLFWEKLFAAVEEQVDAGTNPLKMTEKIDMSQFADYYGYNEEKMKVIMQRVYYLFRIGR